jgi:hypothetical protein
MKTKKTKKRRLFGRLFEKGLGKWSFICPKSENAIYFP